jgi:transcriptional regulator of acetoin/glycerol metabolism
MTLAEAERRHIEAVLRIEQWNVRTAATVLGLSRTALYDRIKKHGIQLGRSE